MKRIKAALLFSKLIFTDTKNILKSLFNYTAEADKRIYVQKKLKLPDGIPFVDVNDLVQSLNENVENYTYLSGTSYPNDIAFLMAMCRNYQNCCYLEIGSWRGESLFNVSKIASECVSVSLSKEEIIQRFGNKTMASVLKMFSEGLKNVKHIEHDSLTFDFNSLNKKFDVIFVDGDHSYEAVKSDSINAFKLLKAESSVIIFHDCGNDSEDQRYEVIAGVLDGTPVEKRGNIYRVSNTLCAIYTNKNVSAMKVTKPQIPNKIFSVSLQSKPYLHLNQPA